MTRQDILDELESRGLEDTIFLDDPTFEDAIIGITEDGHLIYNYDSMVNNLVDNYTKEGLNEDEAYTSAIEWISYNTIRAIPYMKSYGKEPIISYSFDT